MFATPKKIYIIAGEASGDLHGAHLIENLKSITAGGREPLQIYGIGGDKIKSTGALEFFDLAHFHVTGITDAIAKIPQYRKAAKTILSGISKVRPDVVVLIDNPGFNLHLAKKIHALKIPIIYYIAPQVWAWAPKRVMKIKKYITKVLVVFRFEEKFYKDHSIPVAWVGHPLKDLIELPPAPSLFGKEGVTGEVKKRHLVSLLPGSRKGELKMLFSAFVKAARILSKELPDISFALIQAPTLSKEFYHDLLGKNELDIRLIDRNSYQLIRQSDLAIVCSGTATLECALLGTPMIVSYKASLLTYLLAKKMIRVPYLGLPNLILGEEKMPELLQYDATPEKIAVAALKILKNSALQSQMKKELEKVSQILGEPGASERAAKEILNLVGLDSKN